MSSPALMEAFDFTAEELRVNRAGQLSPRQRSRLQREDFQQTVDLGCALIVLVLVLGLIFAACSLLFNIGAILTSIGVILPFVVGGFAILAVAVLIVNWQGARERRLAGRGDVEMVEGPIAVKEERDGSKVRPYMEIDDQTFRVRDDMMDALRTYGNETLFRVYYSHRYGKVLSLEAEGDA